MVTQRKKLYWFFRKVLIISSFFFSLVHLFRAMGCNLILNECIETNQFLKVEINEVAEQMAWNAR